MRAATGRVGPHAVPRMASGDVSRWSSEYCRRVHFITSSYPAAAKTFAARGLPVWSGLAETFPRLFQVGRFSSIMM